MADTAGRTEILDEVKKGAGWMIVLGILTIVVAILAIGAPFVAGTAATIFVGCLILVGGIFELIGAFRAESWKSRLLEGLCGALSIVAGGYLIARPVLGMAIFAILLAVYLLVDGVVRIIQSFRLKPVKGWGWHLFAGIVTLLLGILLWRQWPLSALWVVGTLVGVNFLFRGWAMVAIGTAARAVTKEAIADEKKTD